MRTVPATVRWVPPGLALGASHRRKNNVMSPFAMPSATARLSNTPPMLCRNGPRIPYDHAVADRYGTDILTNDPHRKPRAGEQPVQLGMVVEDAQTGYVGAVVRNEYGRMELEDRHGRRKPFPIGPGYLVDGKPVILTPPRRPNAKAPTRTASGSVAVTGARARVARTGRIYVKGRHDAEIVGQVWGDDMQIEGGVGE